MALKAPYKTRQQGLIAACLAALAGRPATVAELEAALRGAGTPIGTATIYRHLEKLEQAGRVRKSAPAGRAGAGYELLPDGARCHEHLHLRCEVCGALVHLNCGQVDSFQGHLQSRHGFAVNPAKTVVYGTCAACAGAAAPMAVGS